MNYLEEANRCLKCKVANCKKFCPIDTDIPTAIKLYEEGKIDEAGKLLFDNNPLSAICAIVCPHDRNCTGHCVRGIKSQPIKWYEIEKEISEHYLYNLKVERPTPNGQRVAIIGAGPSGLTMAMLLAKKGYSVTLIDNHDKVGGVMRYGIPAFRLPKHYIDRYYEVLCEYGVRFKPNVFVGTNTTIDDMLFDGYSAVFLAVGTSRPNKIGLLGESLGSCHFAIDYLAAPDAFQPAENVVVIGAGNVAMDAARTAVSRGAKSVTVLNNRRETDVTCDTHELSMAINEGVKMEHLVSTVKITDDGVVTVGVDAIINEDGSVAYEEDFTRQRVFPSDRTIVAIGQGPQAAAIANTNIKKTARGLYSTDEKGRTEKQGVFASGDVVTGPRTVVEAVAFTKKVFNVLDEYCKSLRK